MMLSVFSNLLTKESDLRVIDNLCAALCRMIMSNVDAVPLEQVNSIYSLNFPCRDGFYLSHHKWSPWLNTFSQTGNSLKTF